ncbi:membrane protein YqaA with SNARE-associated domain [Alkalispirillum mobile]|uniref:Membrane protein YqaA with SNARE-associated domain n=1 Tax=Alkalispirillum mobile TaxID=85925 RepID=A0A498CBX5_9GAMM|nr:YqaA family protein [Alkalispirillum mobile]RLK50690.1 membrane protein YqaA with SNARE-associated domain [Alkalispirillum mobile]
MHPFSWLYVRMLLWAAHPRAPWYLGSLSFAESSFFPIPPDVMLAPMSLARPQRAMWYATITTLTSVAGGVLGYVIGYFALSVVLPWVEAAGQYGAYQQAREWFSDWGFWVVLLAGFSPVPYKVFTIAAGAMGVGIVPFILASLVGRGSRFYLVAGLVSWGGPKVEPALRAWIDRLGWATVALLILGYVIYRLL